MLVIAHRANVRGPSQNENSPQAIEEALELGLSVEVDVRWVGEFLLGHDAGVYPVSADFLQRAGLLVHCKNVEALVRLKGTSANFFWHQNDDYTLSSHGDLLVNPAAAVFPPAGVILMPELSKHPISLVKNCAGVCSDWPFNWL